MAKLNPPQISSKLPAFIGAYLDGSAGYQMIIPFNLNKAVGIKEFNSMQMTVKSVQTNIEKDVCTTNDIYYDANTRNYKAIFKLNFKPEVGQYYKVQLAFIDDVTNPKDVTVGYYSSVGVIKCISQPNIYIDGRINDKGEEMTINTYTYTGVYEQTIDKTEKVYSYEFLLYDQYHNLVATSGIQIHNSSTDLDTNKSTDTWTIRKKLNANETYTIEYNVITMNGGGQVEADKFSSGPYQIIDTETVKPNIHASLSAVAQPDDGYIAISLVGDGSKTLVNGSFVLLRSGSDDNYDSWYELTKFYLSSWNARSTKLICNDHTVEQGVHYRYAIQAYNSSGLYSDRLENIEGAIYCSFEDAFLWDGERQLKIRFNPKVSSFKSTVLETKTDTIGGKYPFVFRNGNVEYKEFQISGLLSLLSDENNLFLTDTYMTDNETRICTESKGLKQQIGISRTQLTPENYYNERQFKLEVLSWLTNGKPKLFRSPAEGNYIIRLMNTSLSPNDTLGRMLHTFTSTAYEIAECNFDNLQDFGFATPSYTEMRTLKIDQINLNNPPIGMLNILAEGVWNKLPETDERRLDANGELYASYTDYLAKDPTTRTILLPQAYLASLSGSLRVNFSYQLSDKSKSLNTTGFTGTFIFPEEVLKATPLTALTPIDDKGNVIDNWGDEMYLTYGYYDKEVGTFSAINRIYITDQIVQFVGNDLANWEKNNIISSLEDFRTKTGMFHYIRVQPRDIKYIYLMNNELYYNNSGDKFSSATADPNTLYYVIEAGVEPLPKNTKYYLDGRSPIHYDLSHLSFKFDMTGSYPASFDLNYHQDNEGDTYYTNGRYEVLTTISDVDELHIGNGLILDLVYQQKIIEYTIEASDPAIKQAKEKWEKSQLDSDYRAYIALLQARVEASIGEEDYNVVYAL